MHTLQFIYNDTYTQVKHEYIFFLKASYYISSFTYPSFFVYNIQVVSSVYVCVCMWYCNWAENWMISNSFVSLLLFCVVVVVIFQIDHYYSVIFGAGGW